MQSFLYEDTESIVGELSAKASERDQGANPQQIEAWRTSISLLQEAFKLVGVASHEWGVLLEYEIPRRGRRPDAIVLGHQTVFVIEFKCGSETFDRQALVQTSEYSKDLRDFHAETRHLKVVPVLIATEFSDGRHCRDVEFSTMKVECAGTAEDLREILADSTELGTSQVGLKKWDSSAYQPTPDILAAAREVFAGHDVSAINFSHADNLGITVDYIRNTIAAACALGDRVAVFVTGVPGSGKTLAGLNAIHQISEDPDDPAEPLGAYLSGNGPLVDVLRYALAKDKHSRGGVSMSEARLVAETFIQPVRHFIREYNGTEVAPPENVIVFDEAQRAWDAARMESKNQGSKSQAAVVLDAMARVPDWSVVVALVGEGQEINTGEAGLVEWVNALEERPEWQIHTAPDLLGHFEQIVQAPSVSTSLHLKASVRSPRALAVADWADALVMGNLTAANKVSSTFPEYPIYVTRSLDEMRQWLREQSELDRRVGLLASSQARRLRAFGMAVAGAGQGGTDWPKWFVDPPTDIRSSSVLEVPASEFDCQGLEIDCAGLCWGQDFNWIEAENQWQGRRIKGSAWRVDSDITHARNRYRVLLTRARHGMVIWVPEPLGHEPLVSVDIANSNFEALLQAGAIQLS